MDIIEEIKSRISIVDLVSQYVELKPSGSTMKACCPFHSEKTPSFHVFPNKGTWHCFGACGTGGDIFAFMEKVKGGIDFKEAMHLLADQANIPIPDKKQSREVDITYEINSLAAKCYVENLKGEPLEYMQKRGFSKETLSRFQIGLSPAENDRLYKYLLRQGYKTEDILKSGIAIRGERQKDVKDFFYNRIIFPIKNESGHIIGFAGRSLDAKSKVKYINTPQTQVFSKKSVLYGIDAAKTAIRAEKSLILVEGYTDAMMSHQHGFCNTVGLCGSGITSEHMIIIKKYAHNILLALDPDSAGEQATLRGIKIARNVFNGHAAAPEYIDGDPVPRGDIKIIELPTGMDPDVCINSSPAEWRLRITQAKPALDYLFDAVLALLDLTREVGRASAAEQLMSVIRDINDPVEQELYMEKLSDILHVSITSLNMIKPPSQKAKRIIESASITSGDSEEYCLSIILKYGNTDEMMGLAETLTSEHFAKLENKEIFNIWRSGRYPEETHLQRHYDQLLSRRIPVAGAGTLSDCIKFLETARIKAEAVMLAGLLHDAEPEEKVDYLKRLDECRKQLTILKGARYADNGISEAMDQSGDTATEDGER